MEKNTSLIRVRMSCDDAHYGGNLVEGAHMLQLFGDVATELLIQRDGDEGLLKAYDLVEFIAPVHAGEFIDAVGETGSEGNTSTNRTGICTRSEAISPTFTPCSASTSTTSAAVAIRGLKLFVVPV